MGFVLAVALLTWGGVFLYMLRLERLAKSVEADVRRVEQQSAEVTRDAATSVATAETAPREKELV
jgi:hypothetical protein